MALKAEKYSKSMLHVEASVMRAASKRNAEHICELLDHVCIIVSQIYILVKQCSLLFDVYCVSAKKPTKLAKHTSAATLSYFKTNPTIRH